MKYKIKYLILGFILIFIISCKNHEFQKYKKFNMYSLKGDQISNNTLYFKPIFYIKRTPDTIVVKSESLWDSDNIEIYLKTINNNWLSTKEKKRSIHEKSEIIPYYSVKYVTNDTIFQYINTDIRPTKLNYDCKFALIKIIMKDKDFIFRFPKFNFSNESITYNEINF